MVAVQEILKAYLLLQAQQHHSRAGGKQIDQKRPPRSLSDLKEIGCKFVWPVHISPLSWAIE